MTPMTMFARSANPTGSLGGAPPRGYVLPVNLFDDGIVMGAAEGDTPVGTLTAKSHCVGAKVSRLRRVIRRDYCALRCTSHRACFDAMERRL
jgi:hypothetical protein